MADRTAAWLFSELFRTLAKDEPIDHKQLAFRLWRMAREFDFAYEQMECNEALITLGLAHKENDNIVYHD